MALIELGKSFNSHKGMKVINNTFPRCGHSFKRPFLRFWLKHLWQPSQNPCPQCTFVLVGGEYEQRQLRLSRTRYLVGPESIAMYHKGDQTIYIFGDIHRKMMKCPDNVERMNVVEWFRKLFRMIPSTLDIFVEFEYITKGQKRHKIADHDQGYLFNDFYAAFHEFLQPEKSEKQPANTRFHFVDTRNDSETEIKFKSYLARDGGKTAIDITWNQVRQFCLNVIKPIEQLYSSIPKIAKQMAMNPLATAIMQIHSTWLLPRQQVLMNRLSVIQSLLENELKDVATIEEIENDTLDDVWFVLSKIDEQGLLENLFYDYLECQSAIMDGYLLMRLFRTYSDGSPPHNNVIVWAGQAHTSLYRYVLEHLGFEATSIDDNNGTFQCLNIDKLQPFFPYSWKLYV